jgi:hypothetical protein
VRRSRKEFRNVIVFLISRERRPSCRFALVAKSGDNS